MIAKSNALDCLFVIATYFVIFIIYSLLLRLWMHVNDICCLFFFPSHVKTALNFFTLSVASYPSKHVSERGRNSIYVLNSCNYAGLGCRHHAKEIQGTGLFARLSSDTGLFSIYFISGTYYGPSLSFPLILPLV